MPEIQMGELAVTGKPEELCTFGVGSCLVITLHDPAKKIGGMAHAMLPGGSHGADADDAELQAKYVPQAIAAMVEKMILLGASRQGMEAKLVGGASMFPGVDGGEIGNSNVASARKTLAREEIPIAGEVVGGSVGRSVEFAVRTGIVTVKIKF